MVLPMMALAPLMSALPGLMGGGGGGGGGSSGPPQGGAGGAGGGGGFGGLGMGSLGGAFGMLGGAGLGALGGYMSGRKKKKAQRKGRDRAIIGLQKIEDLQRGYGMQTQDMLQQALQAVQGGTEGALRETSAIGRGAKRRTLDREQGNLGQMTQSLTSAGLGSTTRGANLSRAVKSDTDRALLDIDEALAGIRSGIQQQGGAMEAGALGNLGNFFQQRSAQGTDLWQQRIGLMTGQLGRTGGGQGAQASMAGLGPLLAMLGGGKEGATSYANLFNQKAG